MYFGGGGAAWGNGGTFMVEVGVLPGSYLSAKLGSQTQGGLLEGLGADRARAGAGADARGWG